MYVQLNGWFLLIIITLCWGWRTYRKYRSKKRPMYKDWPWQMFFIYAMSVGYLTMRPFHFQFPFTVREFSFDTNLFYNLLHMAEGYLAYQLLYSVGNIMLFVPLGFLLPLLNKKFNSVIIVGIVGLMASLCIELIQATFTIIRFGTVDDLVFNTFGAIIGVLLFKLIYSLTSRMFYYPTNSRSRKSS